MQNSELAYLLGMIGGKGILRRGTTSTTIEIEIPHKNMIIENQDTRLSVKASLDDFRKVIEPLTSTLVNTLQNKNMTILSFEKSNSDFFSREINRHYKNMSSSKDFRIPLDIFDSPNDIKRVYLMGFTDVTGHIRRSNIAYGIPFNHRVYIEIPVNWFMVIDISNLLHDLDIPVQTIDWGHPNMRDPRRVDYNKGKKDVWYREHQIKIYTDEFEKIGFRVSHKNTALQKLANENKIEWDKHINKSIEKTKFQDKKQELKAKIGHIELEHHRYYWQTKRICRTKEIHPMEGSDKIPEIIRNKHFNSWKEIASELGYPKK